MLIEEKLSNRGLQFFRKQLAPIYSQFISTINENECDYSQIGLCGIVAFRDNIVRSETL